MVVVPYKETNKKNARASFETVSNPKVKLVRQRFFIHYLLHYRRFSTKLSVSF